MDLQLLRFSNGERCHVGAILAIERFLVSLFWQTAASSGFCWVCVLGFFPPLLSLVEKIIFLLSEFGSFWPLTPIAHGAVQGQLPGEERVKARDIRRMALESIIANIFEGH